jgi:pyruvate dehydrogenase E2 component (dihydrolipoamide acetyltransferase)
VTVREFLLPDLGEGLEDAEVQAWHVAEGDRVELNQTLVEVNTAKAVVEIPAPWAGVVERLHAEEGDVVKVGHPLVSIQVEDAIAASEAARPETEAADAQQAAQGVGANAAEAARDEEPKPKRRAVLVGYGVDEEDEAGRGRAGRPASRDGPRGGGPVRATPPVRKLAKDLGVDMASVTATGTDGRVTREDVQRAHDDSSVADGDVTTFATHAVDADEEIVPVRGNRRIIAQRLTETVREIPHVTTFLTLDATWLMAFRDEMSSEAGRRISPLPIVVRALAEVCGEHPKLNASFSSAQQEMALYRKVHAGIATDTADGLLVPVVRDVHERGIVDIASEIERLSEAARSRRLTLEEMAGGTITVTNVGTFGAESGTPIINDGQSSILALGVIEPRALVVDGKIEPRSGCTLSLSFDHRILDGAEAGRALKALKDLLESPFRLGALPR